MTVPTAAYLQAIFLRDQGYTYDTHSRYARTTLNRIAAGKAIHMPSGIIIGQPGRIMRLLTRAVSKARRIEVL